MTDPIQITDPNFSNDPKKIDPSNPFNLKVDENVIWRYKGYDLSRMGGLILANPKPTPAAISVMGLSNMGLSIGDLVMVARDTSNNQRYYPTPNKKDGFLIEAHEIKDELIGQIARIDGNRIIFKRHLKLKGSDSILGWPKPGGAVTRIICISNNMIDAQKTEEVDKWKQKHDLGRWV